MDKPTPMPSGRQSDPRVLRTRALLRAAALELAAERPTETITVADLAERATVNRATVYQHYRDRDELLLDAMEDEIAQLAHAAAMCPLTQPADQAPDELVRLFQHVESNALLYRRMLGPTGTARFINQLRTRLAEEVAAQVAAAGVADRSAQAVPADVHAHYVAGAFIGVITHWLSGEGRPAADIARSVWPLLRGPAR